MNSINTRRASTGARLWAAACWILIVVGLWLWTSTGYTTYSNIAFGLGWACSLVSIALMRRKS